MPPSISRSFSSLLSLAATFRGELDPKYADTHPTYGLQAIAKREHEIEKHDTKFIVFATLIPVLVLMSGLFAGLTLGYMSLDETQLNVLSASGTPKQREYARKIMPIRKNGHLLLVTLLLANMVVNETLPVISDPVLGGGVQSVVVSTVLIVLFAEVIPQSICTRHGLYVGAKMAGFMRVMIFATYIVAWPVAKLLEFALGPHHGIIYRRAELKELIAMHSDGSPLGGDLRTDTVTIIGATLDLQEKVVRQAMTPISEVFMLSIDAKLDYETLRKVCLTGHSRIPVYEEVEINLPEEFNRGQAAATLDSTIAETGGNALWRKIPGVSNHSSTGERKVVKTKVKKIIGILLVKQCVLLDPEDAIPVRKMRLNKVPFVPQNEPLLRILDRFQEGRSHMAIVSRMSVEKAQSVKIAVKKGLTQRLKDTLTGDSTDSAEDSSEDGDDAGDGGSFEGNSKADSSTFDEKKGAKKSKVKRVKGDLEKGVSAEHTHAKRGALEQSMPADAVLSKEHMEEYFQSQGFDPAIMPLGIITLEDVLEELIGEEIYDEFDADIEGGAHSHNYIPPLSPEPVYTPGSRLERKLSAPEFVYPRADEVGESSTIASTVVEPQASHNLLAPRPIAIPGLKNLGFLRSRSAPPTPRPDNPRRNSGAATPAQAGPNSGRASIEFSDTASAVTHDGKGLDLIVEKPSPTDEATPKPGILIKSDPATPMPQSQGTATPSGPALAAPVPTQGLSPSLEAFLLDRRRRAQMQLAPTPSPVSVLKQGPTPKAKAFKSSPLPSEPASAGGLTPAELARQSLVVPTEGATTAGSIPSEKDKVGPDIEESQ